MVGEILFDEIIVVIGIILCSDGFQILQLVVFIFGYDLFYVYNVWEVLGVGLQFVIKGLVVVFDDMGIFEVILVVDVFLKVGVYVIMVFCMEQMVVNCLYLFVIVGVVWERFFLSDFEFVGGYYLRGIMEDEVEIGVLFIDWVCKVLVVIVVLVLFNEFNWDLLMVLVKIN